MLKSSLSEVAQLAPTPPQSSQEKALMSPCSKPTNSLGLFSPSCRPIVTNSFLSYHIGESLIPSVRPYFRFIGAESTLASYGFTRKVSPHLSPPFCYSSEPIPQTSPDRRLNSISSSTKAVSISVLISLLIIISIPIDTDFVALGYDNNAWNVVRRVNYHHPTSFPTPYRFAPNSINCS